MKWKKKDHVKIFEIHKVYIPNLGGSHGAVWPYMEDKQTLPNYSFRSHIMLKKKTKKKKTSKKHKIDFYINS